jgi:hypothetical protein
MSDFVTLRDHIVIQKGKAPLATGYIGKGAEPYLNPEYLRGRASADLAKAGPDAVRAGDGDTILLWDGSNAGEFFRAKPGLVASTMAKLSPSKLFRPAYFFHIAKHAESYLRAQTNGTGIPHVDRELLEAIKVFCPDFTEQQVVAVVLDALDITIQETEAIIAKLKAVKQGLLHDLLTRGIDANGELRPSQAEAPHLYKESPLGWIPKEWDASVVASEFDVDSGITLGPHRAPRAHPRKYLRVANVRRCELVLDDIAELEASNVEAEARALCPGDLLVVEGHASKHEIGRCAMAAESVRGMLFQNHLFRLKARRLLKAALMDDLLTGRVRVTPLLENASP